MRDYLTRPDNVSDEDWGKYVRVLCSSFPGWEYPVTSTQVDSYKRVSKLINKSKFKKIFKRDNK